MKFQFVGITKIIEENACNIAPLRHMMFAYYGSIISKEVKLSNTRKDYEILCIGGGYMPCTAILFQKLSGANVTIIDNDKETLESARKLVDIMKVSDKVKVIFCDGKDIDSGEFDVIHIAMQVSPKTAVFDHIYSGMKKGAKLLIRCPKKHLKCGYHNIEETGCIQCGMKAVNPTDSIKQNCFSNIGRTLLYVK